MVGAAAVARPLLVGSGGEAVAPRRLATTTSSQRAPDLTAARAALLRLPGQLGPVKAVTLRAVEIGLPVEARTSALSGKMRPVPMQPVPMPFVGIPIESAIQRQLTAFDAIERPGVPPDGPGPLPQAHAHSPSQTRAATSHVGVPRAGAAPQVYSIKPGATLRKRGSGKSGSEVLKETEHTPTKQLKLMGGSSPELSKAERFVLWCKRGLKGDTEICAEIIASRLAKAMSDARSGAGADLVPIVEPVLDLKNATFGLTSTYLEGCLGNLDDYFDKQAPPEQAPASPAPSWLRKQWDRLAGPRPDRHVKIEFSDADAFLVRGKQKVPLPAHAAQDLVHHLLDSAAMGDNDVNPGNFMVVTRGGQLRIARIDLGHAGNDLTVSAHLNWKLLGGGGTGENRAIDFFTRRKILGGRSKIVRDYVGLTGSKLFHEALSQRKASRAAAPAGMQAVHEAARRIGDELIALHRNDQLAPRKKAQLLDSLRLLNAKIGGEIPSRTTPAEALIQQVSENFGRFVTQGVDMEDRLATHFTPPASSRAGGASPAHSPSAVG